MTPKDRYDEPTRSLLLQAFGLTLNELATAWILDNLTGGTLYRAVALTLPISQPLPYNNPRCDLQARCGIDLPLRQHQSKILDRFVFLGSLDYPRIPIYTVSLSRKHGYYVEYTSAIGLRHLGKFIGLKLYIDVWTSWRDRAYGARRY